jgi:hypothetical protein
MMIGRLVVACSLLLTACAGNVPIDPSTLQPRDVLGIAPQVAAAWSPSQRSSARRVIEASLRRSKMPPLRAAVGSDAATDATAPAIQIQLAGWADDPVLAELSTRGSRVLPALAAAAGHTSGPVVVTPAPGLETVSAYLPASATEPARLGVNPVVLAALDPVSVTEATGNAPGTNPPPPGAGSGSARPPNMGLGGGGQSSLSRALQSGCDSDDGCDSSDSDDDSDDSDDSGSCDSCSDDSSDSGGGCDGDDSGGDSSCGDCSGGDGGDCDGGGGDCSGGGDCGGGDCNVAGPHRPHARGGLAPSIAWAVLPLVCGAIVKRRARRRRGAGDNQP